MDTLVKLKSLMGSLNQNSEHGVFDVLLDKETIESSLGDKYKQGDIVVYYDFMSDDLDSEELDDYNKHIEVGLSEIKDLLMSEGYAQIEHRDGSSDDFDYGLISYRK